MRNANIGAVVGIVIVIIMLSSGALLQKPEPIPPNTFLVGEDRIPYSERTIMKDVVVMKTDSAAPFRFHPSIRVKSDPSEPLYLPNYLRFSDLNICIGDSIHYIYGNIAWPDGRTIGIIRIIK